MVLIILCILGIIGVLVTMFLGNKHSKIVYIESAMIPDADGDGIIDSVDTNDNDPTTGFVDNNN
jgi:hypothetical protein